MGALWSRLPPSLKETIVTTWASLRDVLIRQFKNDFLVGGLTISVAGIVTRLVWSAWHAAKRWALDRTFTTVSLPHGSRAYSALVKYLAKCDAARDAAHMTVRIRTAATDDVASDLGTGRSPMAAARIKAGVAADKPAGSAALGDPAESGANELLIEYLPSDHAQVRLWVQGRPMWVQAWPSRNASRRPRDDGGGLLLGSSSATRTVTRRRVDANGQSRMVRETVEPTSTSQMEVPGYTVTLLGRDLSPLTHLIADGEALVKQVAKRVTNIHTVRRMPSSKRVTWRLAGTRPARSIDSVILHNDAQRKVLDDAKNFLASEAWYSQHGIPYRRGYLFHGVPGTGKSSLISALAGELRVDVFMVSLSMTGLTDTELVKLLNEAALGAMVVLEDVDAAFTSGSGLNARAMAQEAASADTQAANVARAAAEAVANALKSPGASGAGDDDDGDGEGGNDAGKLTFAGILNALDGLVAQESRMLIMTSNHPERLDPALIRPGRVDVTVKFDLASEAQMARFFISFFDMDEPMAATGAAGAAGVSGSGGASASATSKGGASAGVLSHSGVTSLGARPAMAAGTASGDGEPETEAPCIASELATLSTAFARDVGAGTRSIAELQGFLMQFRGRPRAAAAYAHMLNPGATAAAGGAAAGAGDGAAATAGSGSGPGTPRGTWKREAGASASPSDTGGGGGAAATGAGAAPADPPRLARAMSAPEPGETHGYVFDAGMGVKHLSGAASSASSQPWMPSVMQAGALGTSGAPRIDVLSLAGRGLPRFADTDSHEDDTDDDVERRVRPPLRAGAPRDHRAKTMGSVRGERGRGRGGKRGGFGGTARPRVAGRHDDQGGGGVGGGGDHGTAASPGAAAGTGDGATADDTTGVQ